MHIQDDFAAGSSTIAGWRQMKDGIALGLLLSLCVAAPWSWAEDPGITSNTLRIGANMPLEGDRSFNGQALKRGIEAALSSQPVQGHRIEFVAMNDFYDPTKSLEVTKKLIDQGIFLMLGSYGTPTVKAILPLLAENKIPVVGPYTGAAFTGPGDVLNFRASYASEVESVVDAALAMGVKPVEVCGYAQNDAYGMSGIKGMRAALVKQSGTDSIVAKLDQILGASGDNPERNNIGPVGVYPRGTVSARPGYLSLKKWETGTGSHCRLVVSVAVYDPAAAFMAYARYKGEPWVFSTTSNAAGGKMKDLLEGQGITDRIIATQIVPPLDSALPVVTEARKALGKNLDYLSLEGYIVGKLFLTIALAIDGPLTRENFLKTARRQPYDIGGMKVDYTTSNQGSNFVLLTHLNAGDFTPVKPSDLESLFKR
ncbi:MAG: ABC transporter substrate-binding protein [Gammaproteobacteria bacterium]|nr:ABC transporter substrate-binding protein [Gammaproteobacteria bacterium]